MARPIITRIFQGSQAAYDALSRTYPGSLHLITSGEHRVVRCTRFEWMPQATYDALAEKAPTTLYIISDTYKGRGTAHRWPLAADTAAAFFLGDTAVTNIEFPSFLDFLQGWQVWWEARDGDAVSIPNRGAAGATLDATVTGLERVVGPAVWFPGGGPLNRWADMGASHIGTGLETSFHMEIWLQSDPSKGGTVVPVGDPSRWNSGPNIQWHTDGQVRGGLFTSAGTTKNTGWFNPQSLAEFPLGWRVRWENIGTDPYKLDYWDGTAWIEAAESAGSAGDTLSPGGTYRVYQNDSYPPIGTFTEAKMTVDGATVTHLTPGDIAAAGSRADEIKTSVGSDLAIVRGDNGPVATIVPSGVEYMNNDVLNEATVIQSATIPETVAADEDMVLIWCGRVNALSQSSWRSYAAVGGGDSNTENALRLLHKNNNNANSRLDQGGINGITGSFVAPRYGDRYAVAVRYNRATEQITQYYYDSTGLINASSPGSIAGQIEVVFGNTLRSMQRRPGSFIALAYHKGVGVSPDDDQVARIVDYFLGM